MPLIDIFYGFIIITAVSVPPAILITVIFMMIHSVMK
jgi:hypothetical protein